VTDGSAERPRAPPPRHDVTAFLCRIGPRGSCARSSRLTTKRRGFYSPGIPAKRETRIRQKEEENRFRVLGTRGFWFKEAFFLTFLMDLAPARFLQRFRLAAKSTSPSRRSPHRPAFKGANRAPDQESTPRIWFPERVPAVNFALGRVVLAPVGRRPPPSMFPDRQGVRPFPAKRRRCWPPS
jgi:hypothetical protein